mgnify:CR=1 FL=1
MRLNTSGRLSMTVRTLLVSAATMALAILPSRAGPCSSEIDRLQAAVDARIDAIAGAPLLELHEHEVPDLDEAVTIGVGALGWARAR